jgi:two-component system phosphate regulon sensor histidine kinase PhoR
MLAVLVPTGLMTALGIILLLLGSGSIAIITGVLVLAFCGSAITGYILASIFVSKGASLTRVQTDFLSSVSHELRTPLTSMRMFIETLRAGRVTDEEEREKCLALVHQELARLDGLVSRLLELSRLESGRHPFEQRAVPVRAVLDEAVAAFQAATIGSPATVDVTIEPELTVMGDRTALAQAIANLLTNAWKYGGGDSAKISVSARGAGKDVEISVSDRGPGVPAHEQKRIFDHFERGRAADDASRPGSGLGLAIVRAIVKAHKGKIFLASDGVSGSRFAVVLRRAA